MKIVGCQSLAFVQEKAKNSHLCQTTQHGHPPSLPKTLCRLGGSQPECRASHTSPMPCAQANAPPKGNCV